MTEPRQSQAGENALGSATVHQVPQYLNAGGPRIRFYGTME